MSWYCTVQRTDLECVSTVPYNTCTDLECVSTVQHWHRPGMCWYCTVQCTDLESVSTVQYNTCIDLECVHTVQYNTCTDLECVSTVQYNAQTWNLLVLYSTTLAQTWNVLVLNVTQEAVTRQRSHDISARSESTVQTVRAALMTTRNSRQIQQTYHDMLIHTHTHKHYVTVKNTCHTMQLLPAININTTKIQVLKKGYWYRWRYKCQKDVKKPI